MSRRAPKLPLPDHVYPLGIRHQVFVVASIDDEGSVGECQTTSRTIKIADSQDTRRRWTTLLHEYMHATLAVSGVQVSEEIEEVIVVSLEHSLEQFMSAHGREFIAALEVQS